MDTENFTVNELVATYVKIRGVIAKKEEDHKAELAKLQEQIDLVTGKLLEVCQSQDISTIKTPSGTLTRKVTSRYWTNDWGSMYEFIKKHDAPFLLEQRIHNSHMRQFLEENPDQCPAGLQSENKYTIQVRKPTTK